MYVVFQLCRQFGCAVLDGVMGHAKAKHCGYSSLSDYYVSEKGICSKITWIGTSTKPTAS